MSVTTDESNHVGKLFDTAYMVAKEQMPFTKEKKKCYATEPSC